MHLSIFFAREIIKETPTLSYHWVCPMWLLWYIWNSALIFQCLERGLNFTVSWQSAPNIQLDVVMQVMFHYAEALPMWIVWLDNTKRASLTILLYGWDAKYNLIILCKFARIGVEGLIHNMYLSGNYIANWIVLFSHNILKSAGCI